MSSGGEFVGIVGAGTMGAGIAQIAALGGYRTAIYELDGKALERGMEQLRGALRRGAERGRWKEQEAIDALERIETDTIIEVLRDCELVIEAAPEDLDLKRNLFERLATACGPEIVLATNTSSLSVTAIAAAVPEPTRIVGMHFFNPPALMQLVEVIAGDESGEPALELATEVARGMGRTPIRARDSVGFVANRAHHADVGGMSPGSMPLAREIYQEGIRIPPVLLVRGEYDGIATVADLEEFYNKLVKEYPASEFVKASLESVTAAAAAVKNMPADFRVSITNAPGKDSYPISSFTWLLIPQKSKDPAKGKILVDFLNWMLDSGEKMTAELTYAPLPESVVEKVRVAIKRIQ